MSHVSTEYKTILLGTGEFPPRLCEYISKPCRIALILIGIEAAIKEKKSARSLRRRMGDYAAWGGHNISPITIFARNVGVTNKAVKKWLEEDEDKSTHPCNENLQKILSIVAEYDYERVAELLEKDLFAHEYALGVFKDKVAGFEYPLARNRGVPTKKVVV